MSKNDSSPTLFQVHSGCTLQPIVGKKIVLKERRWVKHINAGHLETVDRLHDVEYTLRSPHYVASCMDGPGGKNKGGLCFVRTDATPASSISGRTITQNIKEPRRKTYMHVMVQHDEDGPYVATALFADSHHQDIKWTNPTAQVFDEKSENVVQANCDEEADILYLNVGEPSASYTDSGRDGLILRYALEDDRACGVTIMSYHDWDDYHDVLATHIAAFLHIEHIVARNTLDKITEGGSR